MYSLHFFPGLDYSLRPSEPSPGRPRTGRRVAAVRTRASSGVSFGGPYLGPWGVPRERPSGPGSSPARRMPSRRYGLRRLRPARIGRRSRPRSA